MPITLHLAARSTAHVEADEEKIAFICESESSGNNCDSTEIGEFLAISGSSDHLINDDTHLTEEEKLETPVTIRVAKEGDSLLATRKGTLHPTACKHINVFYVPNLRCFYQFSNMSNSGLKVIFKDSKILLLNKIVVKFCC